MHPYSAIHNAMNEVTNHQHFISYQHEELGKSRINRDFNDLEKILE